MFMVPFGIPLSTRISPSFNAARGAYPAGLRIDVHPVANTGAILKMAIKRGKFQGII
jgi:hypothetical protein